MNTRLSPPAPITEEHRISRFDCGVPSLNEYLKKVAFRDQLAKRARTYVVADDQRVLGYYCLATGAIGHTQAPKEQRKEVDPIPVLVLSRVAVHKAYHNQGIGRALLRNAVQRSLQASKIAGVSALLVHALSQPARRFYLSNGLLESPINPGILYL
ncbi:GNAT family N-acetyltransferase [Candidatus Finniella inopinata]|uniref:N-acetyltransferase n=1 Tax=Candidatus Finniella inopinata TaxID=1696036 RepID=A0A4Q7DKW0_9PROT|nr:GNAT family N-acetyltransferase [Candidatus Finniella inopinata]RZI46764.1 N-acetyltransferase [Candidatus Finniella inopinata]